jgi:hypothetical protein
MSKLTIHVLVKQTIKLDRRKLRNYAAEVRERFDMKDDGAVYMEDIVTQAVLDGDLPSLEGLKYDVDDQWDVMDDADIAELSHG